VVTARAEAFKLKALAQEAYQPEQYAADCSSAWQVVVNKVVCRLVGS
jgi:hypothetical protein